MSDTQPFGWCDVHLGTTAPGYALSGELFLFLYISLPPLLFSSLFFFSLSSLSLSLSISRFLCLTPNLLMCYKLVWTIFSANRACSNFSVRFDSPAASIAAQHISATHYCSRLWNRSYVSVDPNPSRQFRLFCFAFDHVSLLFFSVRNFTMRRGPQAALKRWRLSLSPAVRPRAFSSIRGRGHLVVVSLPWHMPVALRRIDWAMAFHKISVWVNIWWLKHIHLPHSSCGGSLSRLSAMTSCHVMSSPVPVGLKIKLDSLIAWNVFMAGSASRLLSNTRWLKIVRACAYNRRCPRATWKAELHGF